MVPNSAAEATLAERARPRKHNKAIRNQRGAINEFMAHHPGATSGIQEPRRAGAGRDEGQHRPAAGTIWEKSPPFSAPANGLSLMPRPRHEAPTSLAVDFHRLTKRVRAYGIHSIFFAVTWKIGET